MKTLRCIMYTLLQILVGCLLGAAAAIAVLVVIPFCAYMSLEGTYKSEIGPIDEANAMIRMQDLEESVAQLRMPDETMAMMRMMADQQNCADQQFLLGAVLCYGEGVPQDHVEGLEWFRRAAEQGHESAQHLLASIYFVGTNVPKDYVESAKWYRMAAAQGDAGAQAVLGIMYHYGLGVPVDMGEARKWYREAGLAFEE